MKQILLLLLLPCFAMAQYQGNANQKITLGEQTTADGLVYRGVENDTSLITPRSDTSAYIILDTVNNKFYNYNRSTNVWSLAGGGVSVSSFSAGTTGLTPNTATTGAVTLGGTLAVANGGTGSATKNFVDLTEAQTVAGAKTFSSAVTATRFNPTASTVTGTGVFLPAANTLGLSTNGVQRIIINSNGLVGIGLSPIYKLVVNGISVVDPLSSIENVISIFDSRAQVAGVGGQINFGGNFTDTETKTVFAAIRGVKLNGTTSNFSGRLEFYVRNNNVNTWTNAQRMVIDNLGNVGIGQITPTAVLHLKAGTATANTAPLKFTSGVNLTTPEAGAMEYNGTNLFFSPSTTRHTVNHGLTASATLDFPSTLTLLSADLTITVTGAALSDVVSLGIPNAAVNANTSYSAWVSAANTVTVRFNNYSSGTVNPASGSFKVFVTK